MVFGAGRRHTCSGLSLRRIKGVDVLNQLRIELIGLSLALFGSPALPLDFFGAVLLPLGAVPSDFAADGAFVSVKLFGDFGDGAVAGQVLDVVSFVLGQLRVAHGNLSCRKGRMLPHTGLFLLGKVALQMRIRRPFVLFALQTFQTRNAVIQRRVRTQQGIFGIAGNPHRIHLLGQIARTAFQTLQRGNHFMRTNQLGGTRIRAVFALTAEPH